MPTANVKITGKFFARNRELIWRNRELTGAEGVESASGKSLVFLAAALKQGLSSEFSAFRENLDRKGN
jgi:hypothetical protein